MRTLVILLLLSPLYGGWLDPFTNIFQNRACFEDNSSYQIKESWGDFTSLSTDALKKFDEMESEKESSWIPFASTKESLREDFNDILDDLVLALTDDNSVMRCLREMRNIAKKIAKEKREIAEIKEKAMLDLDEDDKKKIAKIESKILKLQTEGREIRAYILHRLQSLNMNLSESELNALLVRIDSDNILQMMLIFDISKKMVIQLQELLLASSGDIKLSKRYYGMNLVLSEIALYIQERYIFKIERRYIPKLKIMISRIQSLKAKTRDLIHNSKSEYEKNIYQNNLKSQELTLKTAKLYIKNLEKQKKQVEIAKEKSISNLNLTRNSYRTLQVGANLVELINTTQKNFSRVMSIQFPEIIPFQNSAVEREYQKLTEELRDE